MTDLQGKRVLFFAPRFFGYEIKIAHKLKELGASVDYFDERPGNSFLLKSVLRLYSKAMSYTTHRYYSKILKKVKGKEYDYVLVVNLEAMTEGIIKLLKEYCPASRFYLYMWDSSQNKKSLKSVYTLFDACFTFDRFDAENIKGLRFRPLFFLDSYKNLPKTNKKYDLSFVGTAHGDRSFIVKRVKNQLEELGLKFFFYLYLNSRIMYCYQYLKERKFRAMGSIKNYHFQSLKEKDVLDIIASSCAVLDIQHEMQTGLTMRTMEILGAGKKLITTNVDIVNYDFYHPNNILIFNRDNPVIDKAFLSSPVVPLPGNVMYKYSIEGWLLEIFSAPIQ